MKRFAIAGRPADWDEVIRLAEKQGLPITFIKGRPIIERALKFLQDQGADVRVVHPIKPFRKSPITRRN